MRFAEDARFRLLFKLKFNENIPMKKKLAALLFTLTKLVAALGLEGYYITAKSGASKTMNVEEINYINLGWFCHPLEDKDLGTDSFFGFSV
jgi:hypothetical protein